MSFIFATVIPNECHVESALILRSSLMNVKSKIPFYVVTTKEIFTKYKTDFFKLGIRVKCNFQEPTSEVRMKISLFNEVQQDKIALIDYSYIVRKCNN